MKKIILAVAVAAIAAMAVASSASAGVERYQEQSMTITAIQPEGGVGNWPTVWTHTFNVTLNPCDGSFEGVGTQEGDVYGFYGTEKITGQLDGDKVSFTAERDDGLVFSLYNAPLDNSTVTLATSPGIDYPLEFKVGATTPIATRDYKNHGEYVKAMGGGSDAAHSCIGMPIH